MLAAGLAVGFIYLSVFFCQMLDAQPTEIICQGHWIYIKMIQVHWGWVILLNAFLFLDGSFFVWLEFVASLHTEEEKQQAWTSSGVCFGAAFLISVIWMLVQGSYMFRTRARMHYTAGGMLAQFAIVDTGSSKAATIYRMSRQFASAAYMICQDAHLVAGILASFSHLGSAAQDSNHILAAWQAKWKHALLFPLLLLSTLQIVPLASVQKKKETKEEKEKEESEEESSKSVSLASSLVCTKSIQCLAALIGLCLALSLENINITKDKGVAAAQNNAGLIVICPFSVALSSPCFFIYMCEMGRADSPHWRIQLKYATRAACALLFLFLFQWRFSTYNASVCLAEHWQTWVLIVASALLLIGRAGSRLVTCRRRAAPQFSNGANSKLSADNHANNDANNYANNYAENMLLLLQASEPSYTYPSPADESAHPLIPGKQIKAKHMDLVQMNTLDACEFNACELEDVIACLAINQTNNQQPWSVSFEIGLDMAVLLLGSFLSVQTLLARAIFGLVLGICKMAFWLL